MYELKSSTKKSIIDILKLQDDKENGRDIKAKTKTMTDRQKRKYLLSRIKEDVLEFEDDYTWTFISNRQKVKDAFIKKIKPIFKASLCNKKINTISDLLSSDDKEIAILGYEMLYAENVKINKAIESKNHFKKVFQNSNIRKYHERYKL